MLKHINAAEARKLVEKGAILVDVREANEHAAENIPGAHNTPLSGIGSGAPLPPADVLVFHCKSGARTRMNAGALASCAEAEAYILDGGIDAWKAAGFPVKRG